jgi:hypothetical protein
MTPRQIAGLGRNAFWPAALLLMALTALPGVCRASGGDETARVLRIWDFERPAGSFNLGWEFPGAKGSFAIVPEAARKGRTGGRISFDLRQGRYVAWGLDLKSPLTDGAQTIAIWVRPSVNGLRIHLKTRDATSQEHIRTLAAPPTGTWAQLVFDLQRIDGHWAGANDGKIHWPISYVQIGVEAPGADKVGTMDLDDLTVTTSASRASTPGLAVETACSRFGALYRPGERPSLEVRVDDLLAPAASSSTPGKGPGVRRRLVGAYSILDWRDASAARGSIAFPRASDGRTSARIRLPGLPSGAYTVRVAVADAEHPEETVSCRTGVGILPPGDVKPCAWVGSVLHSGHGWGAGDLRFLDILSTAGIGVVREEFGWSAIEKTKGVYATSPEVEAFVNALNRRGINLNLLLTYGNPIYDNPLDPDAYARWAGWMARHFEGRINRFEIWNEPHNFQFMEHYGGPAWGPAKWVAPFVELTQKASAAIKAARPDATVITCSEDVWAALAELMKQGICPATEVYAIHPYCHDQPRPEREWFLKDGGRELRELSRKHGGPDRVVITEAGWTTYEGDMQYLAVAGGYPRSSLAHQAQYLVRMFLTAHAAGAEYATQYDFKDDGPIRSFTEHNFGIVREDCSPKPALIAIANLTRLLGQGRYVADRAPDPARARAYEFEVGGKRVLAAYAIEGEADVELDAPADRVQIVDLMGRRREASARGGKLTLHLTEAPLYVLIP